MPCLFELFDIVVSVFLDYGSNLGYKSSGISRLMSWRIRGLSCLGGIKIWKASIDCFVVCYGDMSAMVSNMSCHYG